MNKVAKWLLTGCLWLSMLSATAGMAHSLPGDTFPSTNGPVYAVLVHQSVLYIGGNFSMVGSEPRNGLAAIDLTDGSVIQAWNPGVAGIVHDMQVSSDGCTLYVAGVFSGISSALRNHLGAVGINDLCSDYSLATPWNPDVTGTGVYGLALSADGTTLYVGGDFTAVAASPRSHLAAIDTVTATVTPWNPTADGPVNVLRMAADNNVIYVGGGFTQVGGQLHTALAALSPANNQALAWNPVLSGGTPVTAVNMLQLTTDNSLLYIGGTFGSVNSTSRNNLAAVNTADATLTGWNPGADNAVRALLLSPLEDRVYVGGDFANTGGQARGFLAALDSTVAGGTATAWAPVLDARVNSLARNGDTVFVGGDFVNVLDSMSAAHQGILSYSMQPPLTSVDIAAGAYQVAQDITLSCVDDSSGACAGTWYTTDGSNPQDPASTRTAGLGPVNIPVTTTLKYFSIDNEGTQEAVKTALYAIDNQPPTTTPLLPSGTYGLTTISDITLACADTGDAGCDKSYYALSADGSTTPVIDPAYLYSGPIAIPDGDSVLKFFAVDKAGNQEALNTVNYSVDRIAPVVIPSYVTGTYTTALDVVLSCVDADSGCATIYYTIDGTAPAVDGVLQPGAILYTTPIHIATGAVLRVFVTDMAGNASVGIAAVYSFTTPRSEVLQSTGTGSVSAIWLLLLLLVLRLRDRRFV